MGLTYVFSRANLAAIFEMSTILAYMHELGHPSRGRNTSYLVPPAQSRTCGFSHPVLRLYSLSRELLPYANTLC